MGTRGRGWAGRECISSSPTGQAFCLSVPSAPHRHLPQLTQGQLPLGPARPWRSSGDPEGRGLPHSPEQTRLSPEAAGNAGLRQHLPCWSLSSSPSPNQSLSEPLCRTTAHGCQPRSPREKLPHTCLIHAGVSSSDRMEDAPSFIFRVKMALAQLQSSCAPSWRWRLFLSTLSNEGRAHAYLIDWGGCLAIPGTPYRKGG